MSVGEELLYTSPGARISECFHSMMVIEFQRTASLYYLLMSFLNMVVCFPLSASKAVDCLLDSKWAKAKKGEEAVFTTRDSVVDYCNKLV